VKTPNWPFIICVVCKKDGPASYASWSMDGQGVQTLQGWSAPKDWVEVSRHTVPIVMCQSCWKMANELRPIQ
jgi:hypothetical protein